MPDITPSVKLLIRGFVDGKMRVPTRIGAGNVYFVPSESEEGGYHVVAHVSNMHGQENYTGWVCSCPAFRFEEGLKKCKHILKVTAEIPLPTRTSSSTTASASKRSAKKPQKKRSATRSVATTQKARSTKSSKTTASASSKS